MDWFLYDIGLRRERVNDETDILREIKKYLNNLDMTAIRILFHH